MELIYFPGGVDNIDWEATFRNNENSLPLGGSGLPKDLEGDRLHAERIELLEQTEPVLPGTNPLLSVVTVALPPVCRASSPGIAAAHISSKAFSVATVYQFPTEECKPGLAERSTPELMGDLDALCNAWHPERGGKLPYAEIRAELCAINIELNRRCDVSPRFRPRRSIRPAKNGDYLVADRFLLNDLQVIDLHWLYCRKVKLRFENAKWQRLAAKETFDFQLAGQFAAIAVSPHRKVTEIIQFRGIHRLELAVLQDDNLRKLWRVLQSGRDDGGGSARGRGFVRDRLENVSSVYRRGEAYIESRVLLWVCDRLVGRGQGSGPQLAALYALATGLTMDDPSNLRRALASIERHLK